MEKKTIVGLIGRPGVGKDTVAHLIAEVTGRSVEKFSFSRVLIDEYCAHLGIEPTHQNLQYIGDAIRPGWLHERARNYISESRADIIVIPSIRRQEDFNFIQSFPDHLLISITTDDRVAFERMKARNEKPGEKDLTWEGYQALRNGVIDQEIGTLTETSDVKLVNNEGREELRKQVENVFKNG